MFGKGYVNIGIGKLLPVHNFAIFAQLKQYIKFLEQYNNHSRPGNAFVFEAGVLNFKSRASSYSVDI